MSKILMSYILILKEKCDIENRFSEYVKKKGFSVELENNIVKENEKIEYALKKDGNTNRYYLDIVSNNQYNKAVRLIEEIDKIIYDSEFKKNIIVIREFDGKSKCLSEKLFPLLAVFERKLRQLIYLVITKAYGEKWFSETISDEMNNDLRNKAKMNEEKYDKNSFLELYTLSDLENFIFKKNIMNPIDFETEELSKEVIESMEKNRLVELVERMRPVSLWEKLFEDIVIGEEWNNKISMVRKIRNRVSHNKYFDLESFINARKNIKEINKNIYETIELIKYRELTEMSKFEILTNFTDLIISSGDKLNSLKKQETILLKTIERIEEIFEKFSSKIDETKIKALEGRMMQLRNIREQPFETSFEEINNKLMMGKMDC